MIFDHFCDNFLILSSRWCHKSVCEKKVGPRIVDAGFIEGDVDVTDCVYKLSLTTTMQEKLCEANIIRVSIYIM